MPDTPISALASYGTVHVDDLLVVVDVHDTTMAASGTNKKATISQLSAIIDAALGSTRGGVIYRGSGGWSVLTPGTSGYLLTAGGSGADPTWQAAPSPGGTGTVTSVAMAVPSWLTATGGPITTSGTITLAAASGQTANRFLATPNGSSGAVSLRAIVAADLPATGLTITQWAGGLGTAADGATVTFDLSTYNRYTVQLGGNRTLAVSNPTVGQQFTVILQQDATGSRTVTWFGGILWPGGSAPTLSTGANARDVFTFLCISSGVYLGFTAGQNF